MGLIITEPMAVFDVSHIKRGDLIWAKHRTWTEGKAGFVTSVKNNQVIAQYHPGIGNVTNHFIISISEVLANDWTIRWSEDLLEIHAYDLETEGEGEDES